jgi:hypothetical protein
MSNGWLKLSSYGDMTLSGRSVLSQMLTVTARGINGDLYLIRGTVVVWTCEDVREELQLESTPIEDRSDPSSSASSM